MTTSNEEIAQVKESKYTRKIKKETPEGKVKRLAESKARYYKNVEQRRAYARNYATKLRARDKDKVNEYKRTKYSEENIDETIRRQRASYKVVLRKRGLTIEEYEAMSVSQNHLCAICNRPESRLADKIGIPRRLAVDHDHVTGMTRALLCGSCNKALGLFSDDPNVLKSATEYLIHHATKTLPTRSIDEPT